MTADVWLSVALGGGLGLLYSLASLITTRRAIRHGGRRFMVLVLGGMAVRMGIALVLVALVFALAPVDGLAFVGTFLVVFMIGLVAEVLQLHGRGGETGGRSAGSSGDINERNASL